MSDDPMDMAALGQEISKRTRQIAAEVAGEVAESMRALALELATELDALRTEGAALKAALAEANVPTILTLLKSNDTLLTSIISEDARRKSELVRLIDKADSLIEEQNGVLSEVAVSRADVTKALIRMDAWRTETVEKVDKALSAASDEIDAMITSLGNFAGTLELAHKRIESEHVAHMDLVDNSVEVAVGKVDAALSRLAQVAEDMRAERRSMAASRAHITKAVERFNEDSARLFTDLRTQGMEEIRKATAELLPARLDTGEVSPPLMPWDGLRWMGTWESGTVYQRNTVVVFGGATWVSVRETSARPGTNEDWQVMASGGYTSIQSKTYGAQPPALFMQDTPPVASPANWQGPTGTKAHVQLWLDTSTMRLYAATPDAGDVWVWAAITGVP